MSDKEFSQRIDLAKLRFPTDRVTIGQLRQDQPVLFAESQMLGRQRFGQLNIWATISLERELAMRAFEVKSGQVPKMTEKVRRETISTLNDDYRRYGISSGINETRELVRGIEDSIEKELKPGRPPGR